MNKNEPEGVYITDDVMVLADMVIEARREEQRAADAAKRAKENCESLETQLIEAMKTEGLSSFKKDGHPFSFSERTFVNVPAEFRAQQFDWLQEIGAGHLIKETVHASSFQAMVVKDIIDKGLGVPDFVKVFKKDILSIGGLK